MIAPSSAFSNAITISSISFDPEDETESVQFDELYIWMGYCSADYLERTYEDNYISGTKALVYERTSSVTLNAQSPWMPFVLDNEFFYDPAQGNLIIEIGWPNGQGEIDTFDYGTTGFTMVHGDYASPAGDQYMQAPHLLLEGEEAFEQNTFAAIKASFR